jgi:hypothetical protein
MENTLKVGDKVYFYGEKRPYTIKAADDRYAICTKPFNLKRTVLYTIIDFKNEIRSTNYWIFNPYDYAVQEDIDECMRDLQSGKCELSRRNSVGLNIVDK